jgi:hypothetical protein
MEAGRECTPPRPLGGFGRLRGGSLPCTIANVRGKCHRSQLCIIVAFATQPQPGIHEAFEIHATVTTPTPPSRCEAAFQPPTRPIHLLYATRNSRCVRCVLYWTNRWLASASGAAISLRSPARAVVERCPEGLPIEIECACCVALPSSAAPQGHSLTAESSVTDLLVGAISNGARAGPPIWLRATP